jgi:SAM-dependent methyltransferase
MFEEHKENQKYINYLQPLNQDIFALIYTRMKSIDRQWYKRRILDYGCNNAHLLKTSRDTIKGSNYLGVDVQKSAIDIANQTYREDNFINYDGYHVSFNPTGLKEFPNISNFNPEVIVCHGVFTHSDMTTILETIEYFKSIIKSGGYIIFSLWEDFHLPQYINIFLKGRLNVDVPQELLKMDYINSFYLINRSEAIIDSKSLNIEVCDWIETFYRRDYIKSMIPNLLVPDGIKSKHTIFVLPT